MKSNSGMDNGERCVWCFLFRTTRHLFPSGSGQFKGGRQEGVLCVLLAIDWMHLVSSHIITCDLMHCWTKQVAQQCIALLWSAWLCNCIALVWSDLNHKCIASCIVYMHFAKPSVAQHRLKTNLWIWNNWEAYFHTGNSVEVIWIHY